MDLAGVLKNAVPCLASLLKFINSRWLQERRARGGGMMAQGSPLSQALGPGGSQLEGQGLGAGWLPPLDRECGWVYNIKRVTKRESFTELALGLYKFLVTGQDEDGAWRDFVIRYGKVDPEQLDVFLTQFTELKQKSAEKVIAACRKVYNTPLSRASDLPLRLPSRLARKTVAEILDAGIKATDEEAENVKVVLDFSWLYTIICREIETLAAVMGMPRTEEMLECLLECPPW